MKSLQAEEGSEGLADWAVGRLNDGYTAQEYHRESLDCAVAELGAIELKGVPFSLRVTLIIP